jgi:hypothetical protein
MAITARGFFIEVFLYVLELNGQPPPAPAHPNPPVGQAEDPHGGVEMEVDASCVLKVESCFSSFLDPQFGQAGLCEPVTRISEISLHWRQIYSKIGISGLIYCFELRASINPLGPGPKIDKNQSGGNKI